MAAREEKGNSYRDIISKVRKGTIDPIYLFYGDEIFLADELIDAIILKIFNAPKDDFNLHTFYGKDAALEGLINTAMGFPVMAERQVVILRDADQLKGDKKNQDNFTEYLKKFPESTCFIAVGAKPDFRKNPWVTLKNLATVVEFKALRDSEIPGWIDAFLKSRGKSMNEHAAMLMASRVDVSLREIHTQLEKLCTYVGDRTEINSDDIEAVVGISRQYNVFELCNAIGKKDLTKSVGIFQQMMRFGGEPVYMVVMLNRHFNLLLSMCELRDQGQPTSAIQSVMMNEYRIFPNFFQNDYWPQAQKFSTTEIYSAFRHLLQADVELKSSSVEKAMIMQQLIYHLTTGKAA